MKSKLFIARYGRRFLVDEDDSPSYIELRGHIIAYDIIGNLVSSTNVREHYDTEGIIRYIEYTINLKG